jgi:murein DD-endopeptidase MepM/ murein hydrolase activator NlpD
MMRASVELFRSPSWPRLAVFATAMFVAGCSSDTSRFSESPFSNPFASKSSAPSGGDVTGSIGARRAPQSTVESRPLPPQGSYQSGALPPPPSRSASMASTGVAGGGHGMGSYQPPSGEITGSVSTPARPLASATPHPASPAPSNSGNWHWEGGTPVTIAPGETLDMVAHRYGVPASAIAQANGLAPNAALYPGQRIVIPRYNYASAPTVAPRAPTPQAVQTAPARVAAAPAVRTTTPPANAKVHIVGAGETLTRIAQLYGVRLTDLAAANNIPPYKMVRMGDRIVIPGRVATPPTVAAPRTTAPTPSPTAAARQPQRMVAAEPAQVTPAARVVTPTQPEPEQTSKSAASEPMGSAVGFRWPVRGRVVAGFGPKPTGQQNDGINLAVPEGTPIKAADDGVVAYAGNELKGYGNLVLVRHANGFVTAYAHASELMVKRGDQVKRGQVIAKSGQTGNVASPQLHFEIRKGSTPVDPMQYLTGAT